MSVILWGQYPRSESLVQATRDWDRKRISLAQLEKVRMQDREDFISLQANDDYLSTGQFQWEDLMRPLALLSSDLAPGSLVRFFETNTFWRNIEGPESPKLNLNSIDPWISNFFFNVKEKKNIYTFPFWFLFRQFCSSTTLNLFLPLFERLPDGMLLFVDPTPGWDKISKKEKNEATLFLKKLKERVKSPIALVTTFHSIVDELEYLYQLPLNGIGIDFYHNTIEQTLPSFPKDKFLIAGMIDTDSTSVESHAAICRFREEVLLHLSPEQLYFSHSGPAELLPRKMMDKKVQNLQAALK
jgi:methionine synthase II (cobalamin-independent)